jgi:hypothetical protein
MLICDGFGTYETLEILEFCLENNIILYHLLSHISYKLQFCDVGPFASLKAAYRDRVERLFQGDTNTIGKEHFTSLYNPAREKAFMKRNITSAWAAIGLFPFNPDRMLRTIPKPLAQPTGPEANTVQVGSCPQDEVVKTPVTPVLVEALTSLYNLIKQDAHTLDETSKQRLQKRVEKLTHAAQRTFAECALLHDRNQVVTAMNNEAKVRRSTKSVVLGKAQVMSYEDIEEARVKRATKEATKGKGKRGRKRKNVELEAGEAEPESEGETDPEVARAAKDVKKGNRKRGGKHKSAAQEADEPEPEPEVALRIEGPKPWRAPVARMI